jgi:glutathione S-transferase
MQMHLGVLFAQPSVKRRKFHETLGLARRPLAVPHIAPLAAGLRCEPVKVDSRAKKLENGEDDLKLNPEGQVPALGLHSGEIVTEGPGIVQTIADQASAKALTPPHGSSQRYKLLEPWPTAISSRC